jgi:hypothetical protein
MTAQIAGKDGPNEAELTELDRYGVITVPTKFYTWGGYRYSNARDALAAARRGTGPASEVESA